MSRPNFRSLLLLALFALSLSVSPAAFAQDDLRITPVTAGKVKRGELQLNVLGGDSSSRYSLWWRGNMLREELADCAQSLSNPGRPHVYMTDDRAPTSRERAFEDCVARVLSLRPTGPQLLVIWSTEPTGMVEIDVSKIGVAPAPALPMPDGLSVVSLQITSPNEAVIREVFNGGWPDLGLSRWVSPYEGLAKCHREHVGTPIAATFRFRTSARGSEEITIESELTDVEALGCMTNSIASIRLAPGAVVLRLRFGEE